MNIALVSAYRELGIIDNSGGLFDRFPELAALDRYGNHKLVDDAESADAVLVTEVQHHLDDWMLTKVKSAPTVQRFPDKTYVYCDAPNPAFVMPGLYTSVLRQHYDPHNQVSVNYFGRGRQNLEGDPLFHLTIPDLLFSFSGTFNTHPVRRAFACYDHPRGEIIDTAQTDWSDPKNEPLKQRYRDHIARSKFVLCPRGVAANSFRIFEVLAAGRVPVIIGDAWVESAGPDWSKIAIRVPEAQVSQVPNVLEARENDFPALSTAGKEAYTRYFALDAQFNYIGDMLSRLQETRRAGLRLRHVRASAARLQYRARQEARNFARTQWRRVFKRPVQA